MYVLYYVFHRFDIEYLKFDLCHCLRTPQATSNVRFRITCVYPDRHNYEGFLLLVTDVLGTTVGSFGAVLVTVLVAVWGGPCKQAALIVKIKVKAHLNWLWRFPCLCRCNFEDLGFNLACRILHTLDISYHNI